jgi:hypothetical protein
MLEQTGQSIILYAYFGKAGLTDVTVNVWRVSRANPPVVTRVGDVDDDDTFEIIGTEEGAVGGGGYGKLIEDAGTEDYFGIFHTDDPDVDSPDQPSLMMVGRAGVDHLDADVSSFGIPGGGDNLKTFLSVDSNGDPVGGVKVWITSDEDGAILAAGPQYSNDAGETHWMLSTGTWYIWQHRPGGVVDGPEEEEV